MHNKNITYIVACAVKDGIQVNSVQPIFGNWETIGVNSKQQLHDLERLNQTILAQQLLEQGATLIDASRIDIRGTLTIEQDVTIDVGCVFEGNVHLAKGVHIEPYCIIKNTSIDAETIIHAFSHIDNSIVGAHNHIGPYARLRPQTHLAEHVKVGNFVELKNTKINEGSKVNHLSYVGDATLGKNVNVGAGVITCNYDGTHKHHTHIEDGAFVGSDCQLIAPVTVGKNAVIGAGTTLTKNAPENALTLSRVKQQSVDGWVKEK
jgi:bifunctional UDP-N-acetylglucosamine pyrophosphorylase / glucosamine-1-phosphate N-acetyltransferase